VSTLRPPQGGTPPPVAEILPNGETLALTPLAERVTERYFAEFPEDLARYGDPGKKWCVHDTQHLLAWLVQDARLGAPIFAEQVRWLAGLLAARGYPLERLQRHLELLAAEVETGVSGGAQLADRVRSTRVTRE